MIILIISIFLPALNRKNCDKEYNGFTCNDLNDGIKYVQNVLLKRKRSKNITILTKVKSDSDYLFSRLATVSFALATDSTPVFSINDQKVFPNIPDIAIIGPNMKYDESKFINIQTCNTSIYLQNTTNFFIINSTATSILFSPVLNILYDKIGPAALHILIHLALNLSYPIDNYTNYAVFQGSRPDPPRCGNIAGALISNKCNVQTIIEASKASNFVMPLANLQGWLINLIRGTSPYLYDNVGKGCWKATSYLAGGINPIYPGKGRSELDISRSNIECPNTTIAKKYMKILL